MKTIGILMAAGLSRRFGEADKLLADWRGFPLVTACARTMQTAGCDEMAAVVSSDLVAAALPSEFHVVRIEQGQPMSASFRAGCGFAEEHGADRVLIMLGDMPLVRPTTLQWLLSGSESRACRQGTTRMPPALLMARDWRKAFESHGDLGAREIIAGLPTFALLDINEAEALDIDTLARLQGV